MKALFINSSFIGLLSILICLGSTAYATDSTNDVYAIIGDTPVLILEDDTDDSGFDWALVGNLFYHEFMISTCEDVNDDNTCWTPFLIEGNSPHNLLRLRGHWIESENRSEGRIGINTDDPQWTLDVRSDGPHIQLFDDLSGSWGLLEMLDYKFSILGHSFDRIVEIDTRAPDRALLIGEDGNAEMSFLGSNTTGDGTTQKLTLSAHNTASAKGSDVGFSMQNAREGFTWIFRTYEPAEGFSASKIGTGGAELLIRNTTNDYRNASLQMGNGAMCNASGQWINASSREYKENIESITTAEAIEALAELKPVKYNFKRDQAKDLNVGFIAEDVPDLVATTDRKGLNSLEIVAMLTKVVQDQQDEIQEQQNNMEDQQKKMQTQQEEIDELKSLIKEMHKFMTDSNIAKSL